jgi:hypothetical protein
VALCASALLGERISVTAALDTPVTLLTPETYPAGTRMGLLAPGLLKAGDVPQLAALSAPRPLLLVGGMDGQGTALDGKQLETALAFPRTAYRLLGVADRVKIVAGAKPAELASWLTAVDK